MQAQVDLQQALDEALDENSSLRKKIEILDKKAHTNVLGQKVDTTLIYAFLATVIVLLFVV